MIVEICAFMNAPTPRTKSFPLVLALLVLFSSCTSSVNISSTPSGVDVYTDGRYIGQTPVRHSDAEPTGHKLEVRLKKDGYELLTTYAPKDVRINFKALMGSFLILPLGWLFTYPRNLHYHLVPFTKENRPLLVEVKTNEALGSNIFVVATQNDPCNGSGGTSVLEASVGIRLMKGFQVLERQALDVVSSEQHLNMNGLHDESSIVDAGKLSGAKGVVIVNQLCEQGATLTSMRFVDCEIGTLHWAVEAKNQNLDVIFKELFSRLE